jgi:transcriptional antiterminator RfaH
MSKKIEWRIRGIVFMNRQINPDSVHFLINEIIMSSFKDGWFVIYTKPHLEKKIAHKLTQLGIDNFLPTVKKMRIYKDQKKYIDQPLFPSYLFIYLLNIQQYYTGMDTDGVMNYVRIGKEMARVNATVVNNLKLVTNYSSEIEVSENHFKVGQEVLIKEGALTGLLCEIVQFSHARKALVRIGLLQRNILLTIPSECLMNT